MNQPKMPLRTPVEQIRWLHAGARELELELRKEMMKFLEPRFLELNNAHASNNHKPTLSPDQQMRDNLADVDASFAGFCQESVIEPWFFGQSVAKAMLNPVGTQWDSVRKGVAYESV